jgi:alanine dehydrogenase
MSVIAGKLATQCGTTLLHQPNGGKGKLLGGMAATERGKVVVLGAGVAGGNAAKLAARGGSNVVVFDKRPDRLAQARLWGDNVTALYAYESQVAEEVATADLVVGAVLIPSAKAPRVVTKAMVKSMEKGGVLVDISIDQGGCFETSRPTTWKEPTYVVDGVTHFCVTNMPGAVPQTSSQAISAAILPYVLRLAQKDWRRDAVLASGLNVDDGELVHPALKGMKL